MKYFSVILILLLFSCDAEQAPDCLQTAGSIVQKEFNLPTFTKITVNEKIKLFVASGEEQRVMVETGENLLNEVEVKVVEDRLILTNTNGCNLVRDYGVTKVFVTLPEYLEIRHFSEFTVASTTTIQSTNLRLLTEDNQETEEKHTNGDFDLNLAVDNLQVISNGNGNYFLTGMATKTFMGLYSGDSRIEAHDLIIQELDLYHRGSNKMIVHPIMSIKGVLYSTGDVIAKNQPPLVEVEQFYTGRLIFE